jgi:hypothetical protein
VVASLIGDIADDPEGKPALHIHIVVGTRDGSAKAGHLGEGHARPRWKHRSNPSRQSLICALKKRSNSDKPEGQRQITVQSPFKLRPITRRTRLFTVVEKWFSGDSSHCYSRSLKPTPESTRLAPI